MKLIKLTYIIPALALLMAGGCSGSDDWTPGPQDIETGVAAYFPLPSKTSFIFDSEADPSDMLIEVTVSRQKTAEAASVPVNLSSDAEGFSAPSTVEFAAGSENAVLQVSCAGIPDGKNVDVTLSLNQSDTDTYGIGLTSVTYSVIKADWVEISDNVTYYYFYSDKTEMYPNTYGYMYHLDGTNTFKLTDFFGSGLDMTFEGSKEQQMFFTPLINADYENVSGYDGYNAWFLYNEEEQDWPTWSPGNVEGYPTLSYVIFYGNTAGIYSTISMIYNPTTLYGYADLTADVEFTSGDFYWADFQFDFNLKYNPFE